MADYSRGEGPRRSPGDSPCLQCGRCCRAICIDFTKAELAELARRERLRLLRRPDLPQRREIERMLGDLRFLRRHFRRIGRARAIALNPVFRGRDYDGRRFYVCDRLGPDGRCLDHAHRPYVCEGYPWYYGSPDAGALVVRPCGYERDLGDRRARSSLR